MSRKWNVLMVVVCLLLLFESRGQQARIVFYNVENLFDTKNDSLTNDEEFLPEGAKNWTYERFQRKIVRIYQTLVALGAGDMPAVIGLCEIENREVLEKLIFETPLSRLNYRIVHRESPDARGVDVALLYRPDLFMPDTVEWLRVPLARNESTREILHVAGILLGGCTVHFYVNHWPSRYGGAGSSGAKRLAAASTLAENLEDVFSHDSLANIIIMGDFNDEPGDESIQAINKILFNQFHDERFNLVNLSEKKLMTDLAGTIKHQGMWCVFDQIIVSKELVEGDHGCRVTGHRTEIITQDFLLENDESYSGKKPFRTYTGPGYHNGFSDHLPVSIQLEKEDFTDQMRTP